MEAPKKTRAVKAKEKQQKNFSPSQYSIQWSSVTQGEDYELGGMDDKRLVVRGSLMFCEDMLEDEEEKKVGFINIVKFRRDVGADLHDVLDEKQSWYDAWPILNEMEEEDGEISQGTILLIERMSIDEEHRGRGLGLWMISIADAMHNSEMSLCILKPFPLQHEHDSSAAAQARFRADQAKLSAYYERIGLKAWKAHPWLYRWNGYIHPRLFKNARWLQSPNSGRVHC
jgi:hypothetical protein